MTRQEALSAFQDEELFLFEEKKEQFIVGLEEKAEEFSVSVRQVLSVLMKEIVKKKKEKIMFIYFSLLRSDMLNDHYQVLVRAMDANWHMDEDAAETTFSIDYLFEPVKELKEKLELDRRKYMGKVNSYDVVNMIQDCVMEWNQILSLQLHYMFRDMEENEDFAQIPKHSTWGIYWGEYRDESELVAFADREKKEQKDWDRCLRLSKEQEEVMINKFWYEADLKDSDCSNKLLLFSQFENCDLTSLCFDGADLTGVQFRNCSIKKCSFCNANMRQSDFSNCTWEENDFTGADVENAVFQEKDIPFLHLDPQQLQVIFVDRREME